MPPRTIVGNRLKKVILILYLAFIGFLLPYAKAIQSITLPEDTVKIGFLIPDKTSKAALNGAEIAINKANQEGGFKGKPFKIVVRTMEGPWGTGSKQAVNLIFDENVWAIVGSHDGRNAHLVEQVSTKARIVFLSAWATDPTLAQAFVPWFFSCVPNDHQQSKAFLEEIYIKRNFDNVILISDNSYDSMSGVKSLIKEIGSSGRTLPLEIMYENPEKELKMIVDQIDKTKPECIIMLGRPGPSAQIIRLLDQRKINHLVFGALSLLDEDEISEADLKYFEQIQFISSGSSGESDTFRNEYQQLYGKLPGLVAAYSYDGINCLIKAIRTAGLDREAIQKSLAMTKYEGVTGVIQFDEKGKRKGTPVFMKIIDGIPVIPDK
jgi:branched-chain amino acid transport system substrate-binding protein